MFLYVNKGEAQGVMGTFVRLVCLAGLPICDGPPHLFQILCHGGLAAVLGGCSHVFRSSACKPPRTAVSHESSDAITVSG